jgi:CheY-like chemotaxis protein
MEIVMTTQPCPVRPKKSKAVPVASKPLGKGGDTHKYWQHMFAQWGQGMGYRATIEMPTADGGSVDVVLERDGRRIACEISVTSTVEQEIGNLRKCLEAGFKDVFMICVEAKTLKGLKKAAEVTINAKLLENVRFTTPEDLLSSTEMAEAAPEEQMVRGYKVKVIRRAVSEDEAKVRRQMVSKALMRKIVK